MTDRRVLITSATYANFLNVVDDVLQQWVVTDAFEYEHYGTTFFGISPRFSIFLRQFFNDQLSILFSNMHPRVASRLSLEITEFINSGLVALFSVRHKNTFTPQEVKEYLFQLVSHITDVEARYPSLLGEHIKILPPNQTA